MRLPTLPPCMHLHLTTGAMGRLPHKAQAYVEEYGSGAYLFAYGCSENLAKTLAPAGVVVLDEKVLAPNMPLVFDQMRQWCANDRGELLP